VIIERKPGEPRVQCRCDCGKDHSVLVTEWGKTQSCGCLRTEQLVARSTTHGHTGTSIYMTWGDMVNRCTNQTHARWVDYGGRGISVCDRWRKFENFLADMGERPSGMTLDRIDNDRGYEPGNCRWVSQSLQNRNRRPSAYAGTVRDGMTGRFLPKEKSA
jgi:hypothetical protein